jgi:hypothetical protein
MRRISRVLPFILPLATAAVTTPSSVRGQTPAPAQTQTPATTPAAKPADVASADAIITALYDVISGPAGQPRNWDRFRSLFIPGGRLIPATTRTPEGTVRPRILTVEDYIAGAGPGLERNGFFERELSRTSETYGSVTHAFSTYDSKRTPQDEKPFARGINSIQLLNDGQRWWVVTVFWDAERPENPIPAKYLRK